MAKCYEHKQKRRKTAVVVSFLLDVETLAEIDAICEESVYRCIEPLNRSQWIKRAIMRDLAHRRRSNRTRPKKR